jgi:hypothetical protein
MPCTELLYSIMIKQENVNVKKKYGVNLQMPEKNSYPRLKTSQTQGNAALLSICSDLLEATFSHLKASSRYVIIESI